MLSDGTVKNAINYLYGQMRTVKWKMQPASLEEEDLEVAAFIADQIGLDDIGVGKYAFGKLLRIYLNSLIYGRATGEVVLAPGANDKVVLDKVISIHPFTIEETRFDARGGPKEFVLSGTVKGGGKEIRRKRVPIWKTITFIHDDDGSFEGTSMLRAAVGHWRIKRSLTVMMNQSMDRHLIGVPVMKVPPDVRKGSKQWEEAQAMIRSFVIKPRTGMILRPNWEFETLKLGAISPVDALPYLEYHDAAIARSLGIDWNTIKSESSSVQYNVGALHDMTMSTVKQLLMEFASVINLFLIPKLIMLNWPNLKQFPRLVFDLELKEDFSAAANLYGMIINAANKNLADQSMYQLQKEQLSVQANQPKAINASEYADAEGFGEGPDLISTINSLQASLSPRFKRALGYDEVESTEQMAAYRSSKHVLYPEDNRRKEPKPNPDSDMPAREPRYGARGTVRTTQILERHNYSEEPT